MVFLRTAALCGEWFHVICDYAAARRSICGFFRNGSRVYLRKHDLCQRNACRRGAYGICFDHVRGLNAGKHYHIAAGSDRGISCENLHGSEEKTYLYFEGREVMNEKKMKNGKNLYGS